MHVDIEQNNDAFETVSLGQQSALKQFIVCRNGGKKCRNKNHFKLKNMLINSDTKFDVHVNRHSSCLYGKGVAIRIFYAYKYIFFFICSVPWFQLKIKIWTTKLFLYHFPFPSCPAKSDTFISSHSSSIEFWDFSFNIPALGSAFFESLRWNTYFEKQIIRRLWHAPKLIPSRA